MDMSPQEVRSTSFTTAKKGYDQSEVNTFVSEVAAALETAQNETTAMEARARAAVARLQELSSQAPASPDAAEAGAEPTQATGVTQASPDDAETISRTLLLAQRTADATVAEANEEAERILTTARADAASSLEQARTMAEQLVEDAKAEAREAGEGERARVEAEVQSLMARRDFLESDVEHLEEFLLAQRERMREAAVSLSDIVERVPGGLGEMRRPLLSAAGTPEGPVGDGVGTEIPAVEGAGTATMSPGDDTGEYPIIADAIEEDAAGAEMEPDGAEIPAGDETAGDPSVRPSGRVPLSFDVDAASGSEDDTTPIGTAAPSNDTTRDDPPQ